MSQATNAEQSLQDGDPFSALNFLEEEVRSNPSDVKLRIFLFQLLTVHGQWQRALNQLDVIAQLDVAALAMVQMYRDALRCEVIRTQVFEGKTSPMIFGAPDQWLAYSIEAQLLAGQGKIAESQQLRNKAFDEASPSCGVIDGQRFDWIADADMRLGPVIEAVINGRYYWVPFSRLTRIVIDAPEDLRDMVWMPAHFWFENEGETVALIPTRYPGSQASSDGQILMAKKTVWEEASPEVYYGLGQRLLTTDGGDIPLMDVREIQLNEIKQKSETVSEEATHG